MASSPAITGTAVVNPPPVAPNKAVWAVDAETKTSSASILTGTAVISRKENGKFTCRYNLAQEGQDGALALSIPLNSCDTLVRAQAQAETLIRQSVAKSRPNLVQELDEAEIADAAKAAGPDPF